MRNWWPYFATLLAGIWTTLPASAQENARRPGAVAIAFVPPPLENATYSLGIYETKSGHLVRRLCEAAAQSAFTAGLNGLITSWDGKDDAGKPVPAGRYSARGYALSPLTVEGIAILGNDWTADDENVRIERVLSIAVVAPGDTLKIVAKTVVGLVTILQPKDGEPTSQPIPDGDVAPSAATECRGRDGTTWKIEAGALAQYSAQGEKLRQMLPKPGDPVPQAVAVSTTQDRIYLLEAAPGWQRVRALSWVAAKEESGQQVSDWQTFFEHSIRPTDPVVGPSTVEITLADNPLASGKTEHVKLIGAYDEKGSYLATADGLRLRQISQRGHLRAAKLTKEKSGGALDLYQFDGAAWDEFSIKGAKEIIAFDAGEFEMNGSGEKPITEKAPDPDL